MDKIDVAVKEFKDQNGNKKHPVENLVIYAIKRLDNLPCSSHIETISSNKTRSKLAMWAIGILVTIDISQFGLILNFLMK